MEIELKYLLYIRKKARYNWDRPAGNKRYFFQDYGQMEK